MGTKKYEHKNLNVITRKTMLQTNEHESKCNNNVKRTLVKNKVSQHSWVKTR
jgi:hypothetical protein